MAARPLRRAICAGAKKGTAVALRTILPRYVLPLPRFCYKRDLSVRAVLLRALLRFVVLHYRPLTLRALSRYFAAARQTSRFAARVKF